MLLCALVAGDPLKLYSAPVDHKHLYFIGNGFHYLVAMRGDRDMSKKHCKFFYPETSLLDTI